MNRFQDVTRVGIFGIFGNILLFLIKSVVGFLFSSQAMIADAMNSATDIFASFMTLIGGKISQKTRDEDHNLGHGKAEFIFSLFISLSMMFIAFKILYDSTSTLIHGTKMEFSIYLIFVCIITIVCKAGLFFYARFIYQKTESLLVYSNMIDHRNDIFLTSLTFLSILLSYLGILLWDSIVGIVISCWIFITGFKIFVESYNVLMDSALSKKELRDLILFIETFKEIKGITKLNSFPTGYKYMISLSILVDGNLSTFVSHDIAAKLKRDIMKHFSYIDTVVIHVNPYQEIIVEK